ncbi:MAG: ABC transporter permease [Thermoanaerobaculia bacterium]
MSSPKRSPLAALTKARFLEFVRQPEALFWVFGFPIIMAVVLGYAFRDRPPDAIPIGIAGEARSSRLNGAFDRIPTLKPQLFGSMEEGRAALRMGRIVLLVENRDPLVLWYDPSRPDSRLARLEVDAAVQRANGRTDPAPLRDELIHEKGSRYIDFLLPGLLGLNLMSTSLWGIGFSIVDARIKKTLKLMIATPMRRSEYLASHLLSRFFFLVLETGVILAFGVLAFGVPVRGSLGIIALIVALGGLSFAGLGLACAARTQTLEGANGLMNLVAIPMWLVSGTFFSAERFPDAMKPVIRALPLTALNDALRAVMLEGKGLAALGASAVVLSIWGVVCFSVALRIFRWQ